MILSSLRCGVAPMMARGFKNDNCMCLLTTLYPMCRPFLLSLVMFDFNINPNIVPMPATNPYVNGDPNIRPDDGPKTIHSSLQYIF